MLAVLTVGLCGALLFALYRASRSMDPHGYGVIFSLIFLVPLLLPTTLAVAGSVLLWRRRRGGHILAAFAYTCVLLYAVLFLLTTLAAPGADGVSTVEIALPLVAVAYAIAFAAVTLTAVRRPASALR